MMKLNRKALIAIGGITMLASAMFSSCNEESTPDHYVQPSNMSITAFKINDNPKIAKGLDSVFFSIDLEGRLIFNADSLPKGTDVTSLLVTITYPKSVSSAIVRMNGEKRNGQFDYVQNPSDTIDFTGPVSITLFSADAQSSYTYDIKVNVHKQDPDSICWDLMTKSPFPSRMAAPRNQKSQAIRNQVVSLIEEADGSYTLSRTENPGEGRWQSKAVTLPFTPDLSSFTATDDTFYILDADGKLYSSADAENWSATGNVWEGIYGAFGNAISGIRHNGSELVTTLYPLDGYNESPLPAGFPVSGQTNLCTFRSKWAVTPMALMAGGIDSNGNLCNTTWAFDGSEWSAISEYSIPALRGAALAPYYIYRRNSNVLSMTEHSIWLITGGQKADGSFNKDTYISYDGGVNWRKSPTGLDLPAIMPEMQGADLVVFDTPMSSDFRPKSRERNGVIRRLPYEIDGYDVEWNCPYLYFIGGYKADGRLNAEIWRGVLSRLTFRPIM